MNRPLFPIRLNYRVVVRAPENAALGTEVVHDLPHLHRSRWFISTIPLGGSGSTMDGSFEIQLHPPKSKLYKRYRALTDLLAKGQRIEGYRGPVGAGQPYVAGIIDDIQRNNGMYVLRGYCDTGIFSRIRTFAAENSQNGNEDGVSALKRFGATNELAFGDDFNPYTPASYTVGNLPGGAGGAWSGTTDSYLGGLGVVKASTGTKLGLLSNSSITAPETNFVQMQRLVGRLTSDNVGAVNGSNLGSLGVLVGTDFNNLHAFYATLRYVTGGWVPVWALDLTHDTYAGGILTASVTAASVVTGPITSAGFPFVLEVTLGQWQRVRVSINGQLGLFDPATYQVATANPGIYFDKGATGVVAGYATMLEWRNRYNWYNDNLGNIVTMGTIGAAVNSDIFRNAGPSFADEWARAQNLDGWLIRYTPLRMSAGKRTIGKVDFTASPGNDLSGSGEFIQGANLVEVDEQSPADGYGTEIEVDGVPGGSGAASRFSNFAAMRTVGVLQAQAMQLSAADFLSIYQYSQKISGNIAASSVKSITVLRDGLADQVGLLDTVQYHAPDRGLVHQKAMVVAMEVVEMARDVVFHLDQLPQGLGAARGRREQGLTQLAATFKAR